MFVSYKVIKTLKEYRDLIEQYKDENYIINYENMMLNLLDLIGA